MERMDFERRKPLSLLELCVRKAIDNVRHMESVDGIEMDLLKRILPHCTLEYLTKIEEKTEMDISSITDPLWMRFYRQEFGQEHFNKVVAKVKHAKEIKPDARITWAELFAARKKKQKEAEDEMVEKFTQKIQAERAEKQSKQIKLCTKVPPSSKRSFFGGSGPSSLSNCSYKSPMLKKARMEANSRARLQSAIQKNTFSRSSQPIRTTSFNGQPMRTTTIHRPNSTITMTKPMGASSLHRPNSSITKSMGASTITNTKLMDASILHRPNSSITKPMGASTITNTKLMGASSLHRPNSSITKPMGASTITNNQLMGASSLRRPNSSITKPIGASRQIQNSRSKF